MYKQNRRPCTRAIVGVDGALTVARLANRPGGHVFVAVLPVPTKRRCKMSVKGRRGCVERRQKKCRSKGGGSCTEQLSNSRVSTYSRCRSRVWSRNGSPRIWRFSGRMVQQQQQIREHDIQDETQKGNRNDVRPLLDSPRTDRS